MTEKLYKITRLSIWYHWHRHPHNPHMPINRYWLWDKNYESWKTIIKQTILRLNWKRIFDPCIVAGPHAAYAAARRCLHKLLLSLGRTPASCLSSRTLGTIGTRPSRRSLTYMLAGHCMADSNPQPCSAAGKSPQALNHSHVLWQAYPGWSLALHAPEVHHPHTPWQIEICEASWGERDPETLGIWMVTGGTPI